MAQRVYGYSFIHLFAELERSVPADDSDRPSGFQLSNTTPADPRLQTKKIKKILPPLKKLMCETQGREEEFEAIYINQDGAIASNIKQFAKYLKSCSVEPEEPQSIDIAPTYENDRIMRAMLRTENNEEYATAIGCSMTRFDSQNREGTRKKWDECCQWLTTYTDNKRALTEKKGGQLVSVILSGKRGKGAENPEVSGPFRYVYSEEARIGHVIVILAGNKAVSCEDLAMVGAQISSACHHGPERIWLDPSVRNLNTDACRLLEAYDNGWLLSHLICRCFKIQTEEMLLNPIWKIPMELYHAATWWLSTFPYIPIGGDVDICATYLLQFHDSLISAMNIERQPQRIPWGDHRLRNTGGRCHTWIQCDNCKDRIPYSGDWIRYWGGYLAKTWNCDPSGRKILKQDLIFLWAHGAEYEGHPIDLRWWCVDCYMYKYKCTEAIAMDALQVNRHQDGRRSRKQERLATGKIRKSSLRVFSTG